MLPVASVSKTFVGALLLLLVRDGEVALDSPISNYGIDFPTAGELVAAGHSVEEVAKIIGAGRHLLALITGVLDLSKIEAGRMDVTVESFDAGALVVVQATIKGDDFGHVAGVVGVARPEGNGQVAAAGYRALNAYTPYCVEGLAEVLGQPRSPIPLVVLVGSLVGGTVGFLMRKDLLGQLRCEAGAICRL